MKLVEGLIDESGEWEAEGDGAKSRRSRSEGVEGRGRLEVKSGRGVEVENGERTGMLGASRREQI